MNIQKPNTPKGNILVVDDTPENLHLLINILRQEGYQVRPATTGTRAITGIKAEPPDLILLDIRMPEMSGYEICVWLKSDEKYRDIPVIFISALHEVFDKVKAFSVGGVDYITKPFQAEEVTNRVRTHLDLSRLRKQLEAQNEQLRTEIIERERAEESLQRLNCELDRKVRERTAELAFELDVNTNLAGVSRELLSSGYDIKNISKSVLDCARKLTGSKHGYVSAIDPEIRGDAGHTNTKTGPGQCKSVSYPPDPDGKFGELFGHSLNTRELLFTNDPKHHPASQGLPAGHIPLERFLSIPVVIEDAIIGQIALANADRDYSEKDAAIIQRLSELYALALHRRRYESHRENLEGQLRQTQKLEAIASMAGGITHDFNNILCYMSMGLELAMDDIPEDSPARDPLETAMSGAERAKELIGQILTFCRETEQEFRPLKIQHILKEVLKMIRSTLPATIDIRHNIDENCGNIMADPTQIHQIIMNLITNAYHAMQETGGKLAIDLAETRLPVEDSDNLKMQPGDYICLSVSDTGIGMEESVMNRIFDPYFTTKEPGKGTGLGLSVVYGIIKTLEGGIRLFSEPNKGSEFRVYIPKLSDDARQTAKKEESHIFKGNESILVVDDEVHIANLQKIMLERMGYRVTSGTNSVKAFEALRANPEEFDLVITDMTMPNMTGIQLSKKILEIRPDMPIILCTGYSEQITEETVKAMGICKLVMKPVTKSMLSQTIRDALGK